MWPVCCELCDAAPCVLRAWLREYVREAACAPAPGLYRYSGVYYHVSCNTAVRYRLHIIAGAHAVTPSRYQLSQTVTHRQQNCIEDCDQVVYSEVFVHKTRVVRFGGVGDLELPAD